MRLGVSGEFQFGQRRGHKAVWSVHCADNFLDTHGRRAEGFADGPEQGGRHIGVACIEAVGEGFVEGWRRDSWDNLTRSLHLCEHRYCIRKKPSLC